MVLKTHGEHCFSVVRELVLLFEFSVFFHVFFILLVFWNIKRFSKTLKNKPLEYVWFMFFENCS